MMMSLRRQMSCICLLVFVETVASTLGDERCRVAGRGSCVDPSSQALPTDATGSMLQVKASPTETLNEFVEKEVKKDKEIVENVVSTVVESEKEAEKQFKQIEDGALQEVQVKIEDVVNPLVEDEKEAEKQFEQFKDGAFQAEKEAEQEVTAAVAAAAQQAADGGLTKVKEITAEIENEINAGADNVEQGLQKLGNAIAEETGIFNEFMEKEAPQIKMTLENTEEAIEEEVASTVGVDTNMYKETKKLAKKVLHPYEAVAEASVDAQLVEVKDIFSAVARETENLGDEARGVAHTAEDAGRVGVNTAVHKVAA